MSLLPLIASSKASSLPAVLSSLFGPRTCSGRSKTSATATVQARKTQALRLLRSLRSRHRKPDHQLTAPYRHILLGGRYCSAHRAVMEALLGRRLHRSEHVHHRDGNTRNNHPRNLQLLSASQHSVITKCRHPLVAFCRYCGKPFLSQSTTNHFNTCLREYTNCSFFGGLT